MTLFWIVLGVLALAALLYFALWSKKQQNSADVIKPDLLNPITVELDVDYNQTPQQLFQQITSLFGITNNVETLVPQFPRIFKDGKRRVKVTFFYPGRNLTNKQVADEYARRGLKPDLWAHFEVFKSKRALMLGHSLFPSETFWKPDHKVPSFSSSKYAYACFLRSLAGAVGITIWPTIDDSRSEGLWYVGVEAL